MQKLTAKQPRELSTKQQRFIAAYNGNATEAARAAGYSEKNAGRIGGQLMNNPRIMAAIQARETDRKESSIATREERQKLFTEIMRDKDENTRERLRACELLGKSEGDFLDRQEITGKDGAPLVPGGPLTINYCFVNAIQEDDGTPINPDTRPEEYVAAWLIQFFTDHKGIRTKLSEFCQEVATGKYGDMEGRGVRVSEIVKEYLDRGTGDA